MREISEELRVAFRLLEEEAVQLDRWAHQSFRGGWSRTDPLRPMENRAKYLRNMIKTLKVSAYGP